MMMVLLHCYSYFLLTLGGYNVVVGYSTYLPSPSATSSLRLVAPRIIPRRFVVGDGFRAGRSKYDSRSWAPSMLRLGVGSRLRYSPAAISTTTVSATVAGGTDEATAPPIVDASDADMAPTKPPITRTRYDSVIVGGGPAGLLCAIMLAQKMGKNFTTTSADDDDPGRRRIAVYDRLPPPPDPTDETAWRDDEGVARHYLIGLGHRGQAALSKFGVLNDVMAVSVPIVGRKDWQPGAGPDEGVERIDRSRKPVTTVVLPRDKLVGVLRRHIEENYPSLISLHNDRQVLPMSFGNETEYSVTLGVSRCVASGNSSSSMPPQAECDLEASEIVETNFLIGADGAARTVANEMERMDAEKIAGLNPLRRLFAQRDAFRVRRYVDDNKRVYKTIPVRFPDDGKWRFDLNYSARSKNNSRATFEALPSDDRGTYCALLLMREGDELARADCDPTVLRRFFDEEFPQFGDLIDDDVMRGVAEKPASDLPAFRYAGPRLYGGDRTVLLGDCAHTVKPYFGLGANTALEDVSVLSDVIDESSSLNSTSSSKVKRATREFSDRRAGESEAIVTISRNMDRPGKLGTAMFIGPLILDGVFHGLVPSIFAPNMFAMFQVEGSSFTRIRRRKRLDRASQLACLTGMGYGVVRGIRAAVSLVAGTLGCSDVVVGAAMAASIATLAVLRKLVATIVGSRSDDEQSTRQRQSR